MKTWSCPKKQRARTETILSQSCANQYWSMAGLCTEGCEVDQIIGTLIGPHQFHGVEIQRDIYDANVEAYPELHWHHGDFFQVMRQYPDFNPSLVNADLMQMASTAVSYISQIMYLLTPFDVTLIANLVMHHRSHDTSPQDVLTLLTQCQQFRYAMNNGWTYDGRCYQYPGTGRQSRTVMGSFVFQRTS